MSSILKRIQDEENNILMSRKLKKIKSSIRQTTPKSLKPKQLKQFPYESMSEYNKRINNFYLFKRLNNIYNSNSQLARKEEKETKPNQNSTKSNKWKLIKMTIDNCHLYNRIINSKSDYVTNKYEEDFKRNQYYVKIHCKERISDPSIRKYTNEKYINSNNTNTITNTNKERNYDSNHNHFNETNALLSNNKENLIKKQSNTSNLFSKKDSKGTTKYSNFYNKTMNITTMNGFNKIKENQSTIIRHDNNNNDNNNDNDNDNDNIDLNNSTLLYSRIDYKDNLGCVLISIYLYNNNNLLIKMYPYSNTYINTYLILFTDLTYLKNNTYEDLIDKIYIDSDGKVYMKNLKRGCKYVSNKYNSI